MARFPTHVTIAMDQIMKRYLVRVHIQGYRWWQIRINTACLLIRLAAWLGGFGIAVDLED